MKRSTPALLVAAALLATVACKGNEKKTEDTTTVPAKDTVAGKAVPTTDTLVKTTTTSVDTTKGKVNEDSVKAKADSQKAKKAEHKKKK